MSEEFDMRPTRMCEGCGYQFDAEELRWGLCPDCGVGECDECGGGCDMYHFLCEYCWNEDW